MWRAKVFQIPTEMETAVDCSGTLSQPNILKILTVVKGNCGACIVNLQNWEHLMTEPTFSPEHIRYYFLIESDDDFMNFQFLQEQNELIDYPLILDNDHHYFQAMGLSEDIRFQTFLLNDKNEVLEIGTPIDSEDVKASFAATIQAYQDKQVAINLSQTN